MKKIVTHAGIFHADEICAVAFLLSLFPGTPVERTYTPDPAYFEDPEIAVLDIGRRYEKDLLNFDHHQDPDSPATNVLVIQHFLPDDRLSELLEDNFFRYISNVDCGKIVEGKDTPPTINGIIRACNNLPEYEAFDTALSIMVNALDAQFETAIRRIKSEEVWMTVEKVGKVAIHDNLQHIVGWHELAEADDIRYLVTPNARGGYQITSRDSAQWPIPMHPIQTFLHNSGFLAAYPTIQEAIDHAFTL